VTQNEPAPAAPGVDAHLAQHGKVSYLEIPTADVAQSAAFYGAVFGWNLRGPSFDDVAGGLIGRWVTDRAIGSEPGILPYIYVGRIDETVDRIEAAGGQLVTAPYPEGNLWVATFRDPAGNLLGIWQAGPRGR